MMAREALREGCGKGAGSAGSNLQRLREATREGAGRRGKQGFPPFPYRMLTAQPAKLNGIGRDTPPPKGGLSPLPEAGEIGRLS